MSVDSKKSLCFKEVTCKECKGKMKAAWGVANYKSGGMIYYGVSSFENKEIKLAEKKGVIIKAISDHNMKVNVCPHCGALVSGIPIQECLHQEDEKVETAIA